MSSIFGYFFCKNASSCFKLLLSLLKIQKKDYFFFSFFFIFGFIYVMQIQRLYSTLINAEKMSRDTKSKPVKYQKNYVSPDFCLHLHLIRNSSAQTQTLPICAIVVFFHLEFAGQLPTLSKLESCCESYQKVARMQNATANLSIFALLKDSLQNGRRRRYDRTVKCFSTQTSKKIFPLHFN